MQQPNLLKIGDEEVLSNRDDTPLLINPGGRIETPIQIPKDRFALPHSPKNVNYNPTSQVNPFRYHDNARPFNGHGASEALLVSVQSEELKKELVQLANEVFVQNRKSQEELMDRMTSHELLSGLLFPGEEIINIPPMILSEVQFEDQNEFKVFALQTNYRLILMKVDAAVVCKLHHTQVNEVILRESYKVSSNLLDGIWYYPIPMRSLTGLSMEIKIESGTESALERKRPSWALLICLVGIFLGLANFVEIINTPEHIFYITIPVGIVMFVIGVLVFFLKTSFSKANNKWHFSTKTRCIKIGYIDPLTQNQTVAKWSLEHSYTLQDAKYFLTMLQKNAPQLSGMISRPLERKPSTAT